MTYQRINLPKAVVYLSEAEIHHLLLQNIELYKLALARGKAFSRADSKRDHYEKKWAGHEESIINKYIQ